MFPCCPNKKESGFGLLVSRRSRQRNSFCRSNRKKKVKKTRPDVSDRKTSPDAPGTKKKGFFFGPVDPNTTRGHRQTPPNAASRSSQHAQKSPFCRRGINHRPFSSGSVSSAQRRSFTLRSFLARGVCQGGSTKGARCAVGRRVSTHNNEQMDPLRSDITI